MTIENITLFRALTAKMDYLGQRQRVISQNISNSDTPGYKPMDLKAVDFGRTVNNVTKSNRVRVETTHGQHFPLFNEIEDPREERQRKPYEVSPSGNSVIMEEQLIKAGATVTDFNLVTNLYQKNLGLIRKAVGRGQ